MIVDQPLAVDSHGVQDRGVQVCRSDGPLSDCVADGVGFAEIWPPLTPPPANHTL